MELLKLLEILLRRKRLFLCGFAAFFLAVVLATHMITPTYESKAKLLIGDPDVLNSLMLALGVGESGKSGTGPTVDSGGEYETGAALATITPLLEELISALELKRRSGDRIKTTELVKSSLLNKILPQPYLEVQQYNDADMLEIVSTSPDAAESAEICNKLAELFISDTMKRTREDYKTAKLFIADRIQLVKQQYEKTLSEYKDFMLKERTVDYDQQTELLLNRIDSLSSSLENNEKTIIESEREIASIKEQLKGRDEFRKESTSFAQSEQLNTLKTKLNELLINIAESGLVITGEHPDYKKLEKELETVRELAGNEAKLVLDSEKFGIDSTYDELSKRLIDNVITTEISRAKKKFLQQYLEKYQDQLLLLPSRFFLLSKIQLALSVDKEMYRSLLEYLTQIGIAESVSISRICLVEPAFIPTKVHFPNKTMNYVIGVLLGQFWALALVLLAEYVDNTVRSDEDVKRIAPSLPLLGSVPKSTSLKYKNVISRLPPTAPVIEAYRAIRNNLRRARGDKAARVILVTSSIPGEGKSSVSSNLAIVYHMGNGRVIALDMNLRNPGLHKFFGAENSQGIANVLSGDIRLDEAIVHTKIEGLDLLPCGPVPADPAMLVESEKLKTIITTLAKRYGTVIVDTPSVIAVNDPVVTGILADAVVFVMESSRLSFPAARLALQRLENAGLSLAGVVLNKAGDGTSICSYYPGSKA